MIEQADFDLVNQPPVVSIDWHFVSALVVVQVHGPGFTSLHGSTLQPEAGHGAQVLIVELE